MFKKGSKLYSIFKYKCPHCHEGDFFESRNPYNLKKAGEIPPTCKVCGRNLRMEPGFYFGAMYVAYGLAVATCVSVFVATYVLYPEASIGLYIGLITAALVLIGPLLYALSKIIWINFFVGYKGIEPEKKDDTDSSLEKNSVTSI